MLTDTHCHLFYDELENNLHAVLQRAHDLGVGRFICVATNLKDSRKCLQLSVDNKNIFASAGIHPHDAEKAPVNFVEQIHELMKNKTMVAVGEMGLDYFKSLSKPKIQKKVFRAQMQIATELNKPIIFHNRDADNDIIEILKQHSFNRAIAHCYSSDISFAEQLIDLNVLLSFSGNVTFKNSINQSAIQNIALKDFVLETDCPFLAPQPFRGKPNEPKYVKDIALFISDLLDIEFEEIASQTTSNAESFFKI